MIEETKSFDKTIEHVGYDKKVFVERASPLTPNGIRSMCCTEAEYNWYCRECLIG